MANKSKPVQTKEEILSIISVNKKKIRRFGVNKIGLFGSYARGQSDVNSDVDILVQFSPKKKTFRNFVALAELLESLLHKKVELVTLESLSPYLRPYIVNEVKYA